MSKRKYLCFDCHVCIRREPYNDPLVRCSSCGKECISIGYKIPVPPKSKSKLWEKLKKQVLREQEIRSEASELVRIHRKHSLEKEIAKLERLESNSGRKSRIKLLKCELDTINA